MERLWAETENLSEIWADQANAEIAHKTRYAQEYLKAEGTIAEREAQATVAADREFVDRKMAEARLGVQRELLSTLRAELDGVRSLNANARAVV
jgi:hypothetical protein